MSSVANRGFTCIRIDLLSSNLNEREFRDLEVTEVVARELFPVRVVVPFCSWVGGPKNVTAIEKAGGDHILQLETEWV